MAAYGIAWGLTSFLSGTINQTRQMSMVLVHDRASFNTVFRCVLGFGIIHLILLACLSLTPIGVLVIDGLHDIDPDLGKIVRKSSGIFSSFPIAYWINAFFIRPFITVT